PAANVQLAFCYLQQWISQQSPDAQPLAQALEATQQALALNASYVWIYVTLGYLYLYQQQYDQAVTEMERAVALAPSEAIIHALLAETLSLVGRTEDALEAAKQALHLPPGAVDQHLHPIGVAYGLAGRPEEAIAPLKQYLSRYPNILDVHLT